MCYLSFPLCLCARYTDVAARGATRSIQQRFRWALQCPHPSSKWKAGPRRAGGRTGRDGRRVKCASSIQRCMRIDRQIFFSYLLTTKREERCEERKCEWFEQKRPRRLNRTDPIEKLRASQSNRNDARLCVGAPLKRERGTEDEKYGYRILRLFFPAFCFCRSHFSLAIE